MSPSTTFAPTKLPVETAQIGQSDYRHQPSLCQLSAQCDCSKKPRQWIPDFRCRCGVLWFISLAGFEMKLVSHQRRPICLSTPVIHSLQFTKSDC